PPYIDRLVAVLAEQAAREPAGSKEYFKDLVNSSNLPNRWYADVADVWLGNANFDARRLVRWALGKDINPNDLRMTTLGTLLKTLLPLLGAETRSMVAAML